LWRLRFDDRNERNVTHKQLSASVLVLCVRFGLLFGCRVVEECVSQAVIRMKPAFPILRKKEKNPPKP
jgi:hypothetical protein